MAEHNEVAYTTADGNDYQAHEQTYEGFIMLVKSAPRPSSSSSP